MLHTDGTHDGSFQEPLRREAILLLGVWPAVCSERKPGGPFAYTLRRDALLMLKVWLVFCPERTPGGAP